MSATQRDKRGLPGLPGIESILARLASVPADQDEARRLLHRRVTMYLGFFGMIWMSLLPIDIIITALSSKKSYVLDTFLRVASEPSERLHFAIATALLIAYVILRRRKRAKKPFSMNTLAAIDIVATLSQSFGLAVFTALSEPIYRPELASMLGVAHVLALRAAITPTPPSRTVYLGLASSLAMIIGTAYLQVAKENLPNPLSPPIVLTVTTSWCAIMVLVTALISAVIYGLRNKATAAIQLGQYTLEEKIGEGGMGVVYRARHALLKRATAIKLLKADRMTRADLMRFEREVQLTSKLSHPNIIAVYDFGRSPTGLFYYAMEHLDGVDLEHLVRQEGALPPARVLHILRQAADALADAHAIGLIHRDIKPANIILCDRARKPDLVKLVDFGLVKKFAGTMTDGGQRSLSDAGALKGTPLYMAPESIAAPDTIDGRTDLYALGAVGYFLLTGRPPFEGKSVVEVCGHHLHSKVPPMPESIPKKLANAIQRCLAKKKEDRFDDAGAFADALLACDDVDPWLEESAAEWWRARASEVRAASKKKREPIMQSLPVSISDEHQEQQR